MAVQIPDPGTGNGQTGDNEYVFRKKVRDNFSDQNNAASREVGTTSGTVPIITNEAGIGGSGWGVPRPRGGSWDASKTLAEQIQEKQIRVFSYNDTTSDTQKLKDITGKNQVAGTFLSLGYDATHPKVMFFNYLTHDMFIGDSGSSATDLQWKQIVVNGANSIYAQTTASGANVVVDNTGKIMRSTSSERYKNIIADLELDDAAYDNAMQLAPIIYRSTADADNPNYHYYSFSAEALGAYDPAFTLWRDTETVTDADGNVTEQMLDERVAEGINLNAIVAFLHATNIKQGKLIADLERRLSELEAAPEV
ncbi:hypothetical protein NK638_00350 [Psychrobacter sp. A3]|uniref:hypothetical protein n=1 Tax=Psychrobacter sp. A3 TaxID=2992754 RepID=UPI00237A42D3|nr:hypothetical protein [Psychrobacter sp. A3]MDE0490009.1 hypothetical protein [Psychrobacter sp. A3]